MAKHNGQQQPSHHTSEAHGQGQGQGQTSRKRKQPPSDQLNQKQESNKRPKTDHRARLRDARTISKQTSLIAFKNGELDVEKFVKAREYEICALEDGMSKSKERLMRRAFQQVPKELRRRTASHNVKRVPKRLRARAKKEVCFLIRVLRSDGA